MVGYPTLNEIAWQSGAGVCIIVEGETEQEDAWFYKQWFDDRAREVSFFPQDGAEKVAVAVEQLRATLGRKQVYGLIDRDFADDQAVTYPPIPADGVLRTKKYTLENYLLDPACWFEYVRPLTRRSPKPGWNTVEEAEATLVQLYRECTPLAAYNRTLRQARAEDYVAFKALDEAWKRYKEHPKALDNVDVLGQLQTIQTQMGLTDVDLPQFYTDHLTRLQNASLNELETGVSGKYVLTLLREQFPLKISGRQAWDDVLGAYIDTCSDPPPDLADLIDLILTEAHS